MAFCQQEVPEVRAWRGPDELSVQVVLLRGSSEKPKEILKCTAERCLLGVVPKEVQRHTLSSGSFGGICRVKKCVGTRAKAGLDFPFQARKAWPGQGQPGDWQLIRAG